MSRRALGSEHASQFSTNQSIVAEFSDTITKVTNLVRFIKEQKYYFESERIPLYNVQVISLLVHLQMNH